MMRVAMWAMAMLLVSGTTVIAHADGIPNDPNIVLHTVQGPGGGDPPPSDAGESQANPLVVPDGSGLTAWTYDGPDVPTFYVEIVPAPGESDSVFESERFMCTAGAATDCFGASPEGPLPAVEYGFDGPFLNTDGVSQDDIVSGDTVYISAPEPSSFLLLLCGLAPVAFFGLRRKGLTLS
jgi:hypothetical protein